MIGHQERIQSAGSCGLRPVAVAITTQPQLHPIETHQIRSWARPFFCLFVVPVLSRRIHLPGERQRRGRKKGVQPRDWCCGDASEWDVETREMGIVGTG